MARSDVQTGGGPVLFDAGPSIFSTEARNLLEGEDQVAWGSAMYGDFPHGPDLRLAVVGGYGLEALEEADMRMQAWRLLADQAAVAGLSLGRFTYREIGETLGISTAAAHKRYAHLVRADPSGSDSSVTS